MTGTIDLTGDCDGVTHWKAEVVADEWRFASGRVEVSAGALFWADESTEEKHGTARVTTVRLRRAS